MEGKVIIFIGKKNGYERKIEVAVIPGYLDHCESDIFRELSKIFDQDLRLGTSYVVFHRKTRKFVAINEPYKILE